MKHSEQEQEFRSFLSNIKGLRAIPLVRFHEEDQKFLMQRIDENREGFLKEIGEYGFLLIDSGKENEIVRYWLFEYESIKTVFGLIAIKNRVISQKENLTLYRVTHNFTIKIRRDFSFCGILPLGLQIDWVEMDMYEKLLKFNKIDSFPGLESKLTNDVISFSW